MSSHIVFGDWKLHLKDWLKENKPSSTVCIADENVQQLHDLSWDGIPTFLIQAKEKYKSVETLEEIWTFLTKHGIDRHSVLIAIGGGLTTDMAGFAAATYMRGMKAIYVPTTLLGMVDASLGGKTAVNFQQYKNRLGSFSEPKLIIQDATFLNTLPEEEWLSGWAETVKHALIADRELWSVCSQRSSWDSIQKDIADIIPESIGVKEIIVARDFSEKGERKKLNFGHTTAHALESLYLKRGQHLSHGYAVAAGMFIETDISGSLELLPPDEERLIKEYIDKTFPKVKLEGKDIPWIMDLMKGDKKNKGDEIDFTLLEMIGSAVIDNQPPAETIESGIRSYIDGL